MTKKAHEFIARVISDMPDHAASLRAQKASCAQSFADALKRENPAFKPVFFLKACNLKP